MTNPAARRPVFIPNGHAHAMENNPSHSPIDLPTPPDGVSLGSPASAFRDHSQYSARKTPLHYTPAYRAELPRYTPLTYPSARSYGIGLSSSFQLSAERQNAAADSDASFDNDMSVDDVFAVSGKADHRHRQGYTAGHTHGVGADDTYSSPGLIPVLENDDVVPILDHSSGGSGGLAQSVPETLGRSPSTRRSSSLVHTPSTSNSRHMPYNVPSRSLGSMGPFSQAYAMGLKAPAITRATGRRPSWSPYSHAFMMTRMGTSLPASSYALCASCDDDETDDEITGVDDDGTDEEPEMSAQARYIQGVPMRASMSYGTPAAPHPIAHSMPTSHTFMPRSPEDASRSQVHMAAAALDRLSMTSTSYDDDKHRSMRGATLGATLPPLSASSQQVMDETDEVAAIRDRLGGAANCSAFISKLWHLMINPELYGKYIHWNEAGDAIIINSEPDVSAEFAAEVLPKLFKHGNNASFVRQLNLYGFQRVSSSRLLDAAEMQAVAARTGTSPHYGTSAPFNTAMELYGMHSSFAHPRFRRGQEAWLVSMKPRSSKKPKKPATTDEQKQQS